MHTHILLKSEQGWSDQQIMEAFGAGEATIWRGRRRFLENGFEDALSRHSQPERPEKRILNGVHEAHLIALCCWPQPEGRARWSMTLTRFCRVSLDES